MLEAPEFEFMDRSLDGLNPQLLHLFQPDYPYF